MERPLALVLDADAAVRDAIATALAEHGVATLATVGAAGADAGVAVQAIDLLWIDAATAGTTGVRRWLPRAEADGTGRPVVVALTAAGEEARADALLDAGAIEVLVKPLAPRAVERSIARALRQHALVDELDALRRALGAQDQRHGLIGDSAGIRRLRSGLERAAAAQAPVWLWGEAGSGKEMAARTLHRLAAREGPFLAVGQDVGELDLPRLARQAAGGVLYLTDLAERPATVQAAVARWIETEQGHGSSAPWLVAGSEDDPRRLHGQGLLVERLYQRCAEATLQVPPLRERIDDLPLLVQHVLSELRRINQLPPLAVDPEALAALESHAWPENVRELRAALERAVIVSEGGVIRLADLPERLRTVAGSGAASPAERAFRDAKRRVVEAFERAYLEDVLRRHAGNVTAASQHAGMLRSALQRLLRKHELRSSAYRGARRAQRAPETDTPPSS